MREAAQELQRLGSPHLAFLLSAGAVRVQRMAAALDGFVTDAMDDALAVDAATEAGQVVYLADHRPAKLRLWGAS